MKFAAPITIFILLGLALSPALANEADRNDIKAVVPWFTDASIDKSIRMEKPDDALPDVDGSCGKGVALTHAVSVDNSLLQQDQGMISFWIKPNWDGDDGKAHHLLRVGDPDISGILVEKASTGMLRYVMASPYKITSARADISDWVAGEWHHITIVWMSFNKKPLGTPLWIDKVAVAGPIASGNAFLDPEIMDDKRVWIGDESSDAVMDELIMRKDLSTELSREQIQLVYRDHFRTAPYCCIEIDPEPSRIATDLRVIKGFQKQFGLKAGLNNDMVRITDFVMNYGQWSYHDAKPFIKWSVSDKQIATVDENGLVTGKELGNCQLIAEFRGMKATYDLRVIPVEQPDLDLICVSRLPRYSWESRKDMPDSGDVVESVARIENFGFEAVPAGAVVRFELLPDLNQNFRLDENETAIDMREKKMENKLAPREQMEISFSWVYSDNPLWVRVTLDPENQIAELCEANNSRCELNIARPMHWGYNPSMVDLYHTDKKINLVGSFSYFDYSNAHNDRTELLLRDAVWPTTSSDGARDSIRSDNFLVWTKHDSQDEPYWTEEKYYDGGRPGWGHPDLNLMALNSGEIHECGHTCISQPDLYGYSVKINNVLLKDEDGNLYSGGELMPLLDRYGTVGRPISPTPVGQGYTSLMDYCHMWLHPAHAGHIQYYAGYRGHRFWGSQGRLIPTRENVLHVYDVEDQPLAGAAVYIYHVINTGAQDASTKYFADRPKFTGITDKDGRFIIPKRTDEAWDDPRTDEVEGSYPVWNPFAQVQLPDGGENDVAFTPNVWEVQGLLLLKIVSDEKTEFHWMSLLDFNEAFFRGQNIRGEYPIRTNLHLGVEPAAIVRPEVPEAVQETNLKPIADVPEEITVKLGEEFHIDASGSSDPEGQPLLYYWRCRRGSIEPRESSEAVYRGIAKNKDEAEIHLYVNDGLRISEIKKIKVIVKSEE